MSENVFVRDEHGRLQSVPREKAEEMKKAAAKKAKPKSKSNKTKKAKGKK